MNLERISLMKERHSFWQLSMEWASFCSCSVTSPLYTISLPIRNKKVTLMQGCCCGQHWTSVCHSLKSMLPDVCIWRRMVPSLWTPSKTYSKCEHDYKGLFSWNLNTYLETLNLKSCFRSNSRLAASHVLWTIEKVLGTKRDPLRGTSRTLYRHPSLYCVLLSLKKNILYKLYLVGITLLSN